MEILGPGLWCIIHSNAYVARRVDEQKKYCQFLRKQVYLLPCPVCFAHATDYLENNPPEDYILININKREEVSEKMRNIPVEYSMFRYTYLFHSAVNERKNKDNISWDDAFGIYRKITSRFHVPPSISNYKPEIQGSVSSRKPMEKEEVRTNYGRITNKMEKPQETPKKTHVSPSYNSNTQISKTNRSKMRETKTYTLVKESMTENKRPSHLSLMKK